MVMKTEEIGKKDVELTRQRAWHEAIDTLYADDIVSVEAHAMRSIRRGFPTSLNISVCRKPNESVGDPSPATAGSGRQGIYETNCNSAMTAQ